MGKNVLCVSAATWYIEKPQYRRKRLQSFEIGEYYRALTNKL